jgi:hypothetical protein
LDEAPIEDIFESATRAVAEAPVEEASEVLPVEAQAEVTYENKPKEDGAEDDSDKSPEDLLSEFEKMLG